MVTISKLEKQRENTQSSLRYAERIRSAIGETVDFGFFNPFGLSATAVLVILSGNSSQHGFNHRMSELVRYLRGEG